MVSESLSPRQRIELTCPECGHTQWEPAMVVSTQCQSCRANFQVVSGKAVVRTRPVTRLRAPRLDSDPLPEPPPQESKPPFRREPDVPVRRHPLLRFLFPDKPPRQISCFDCGHFYTAAAEAQSSQCPKCSCYVSLLDYQIDSVWNRRIQTRGNVVILKSGSVSGCTIQCHDLTVIGELAAAVDCSGDLVIRGRGKVLGLVSCRRLRVERGARIEFMLPVTAAAVWIDGHVRGQITCTGSVTLEKRAHLHGLVQAAAVVIKPGAKHAGTVEIIQSDA